MNLRSFFSGRNSFWGKLLGGFFGYIMAGHVGALFGILIGNVFDRGLNQHYNRPYWEIYAKRKSEAQKLFLDTVFKLLGYLAKSDGRVTESSIAYASRLMQDLRLGRTDVEKAKTAFQQGKTKQLKLTEMLLTFKAQMRPHPELVVTMLNILYQSVQIEGPSFKKIQTLNHIFELLGYAPIDQQFRFHQDYSNHSQRRHHTPRSEAPPSIAVAYSILGVDENASQSTVKQAYRRLISKNHPDKLVSQGKSENEIKAANHKTQEIRKAYEQICTDKGWT